MRHWGWALVVFCTWTAPLHAAELALSWEFPHDVVVDSFLVTYHSSTDLRGTAQQFRVPRATTPTCAALGPTPSPDAVCARPPTCLPPGLYRFMVQAERGADLSEPSNAAVCEALPNCTYNCQQFDEANAVLRDPTGALPALTAVPPPDPAPLEALKAQLAELERQIPQQPATPIVATPPT